LEKDLAYLQRRILQEREAAASANTERARQAHRALAEQYERMLSGQLTPTKQLSEQLANAR
jgi:hypothetical protein